jgi:hypothetical protein
MALIIEDGTIVPGADSFVTAAELVTYADNYGLTIPAVEADQERLLRRAALQMQSLSWKGEIVSASQALSWPRMNVYIGVGSGLIWNRPSTIVNDYIVPANAIPNSVKQGQMALAAEIYADDLSPAENKQGPIVSETVGPLSTTYGEAKSWITRPAATRQSYANFGPYLNAANQVRMARG